MLSPTFANQRVSMYLADCRTWLRQQPDENVDLIVTDPPYGLDYESDVFGKIEGDKELPLYWIEDAQRVLKTGHAMYIFCHWKTWSTLEAKIKYISDRNKYYFGDPELIIKNMIVLKKSNHGRGDLNGQYAPKHELIMFVTKGRHILRFPYMRTNDVWDVPWFSSQDPNRMHATEKPLSWYTQPIINSSEPGDTVVDLFGGSGSCGEEALRNGRNTIYVELDRTYFLRAKKRLERASLSGQMAMDEMIIQQYRQGRMFK